MIGSSLKDELMRRTVGYRDLVIMKHLVDHGKDEKIGKHALTHHRLLANSVPNFIRYQYWNMLNWVYYFDDGEFPSDVHAVNNALPLYVEGLYERNRLLWEGSNLFSWAGFAKGKAVLEVGYGSGFYSRVFCQLAEGHVWGIEKDDVKDYVLLHRGMPENFISFGISDVLNGENICKTFDVIFFSEVMHGRSPREIRNMARTYSSYLSPDGIFVVNELQQGTSLGELFSLNMQVHGKGGRLYSEQEIMDMLGIDSLSLKINTDFHWTIGGRPDAAAL